MRHHNQPTYPLTILYDRACAVCRTEMHELRARDTHSRLRLVDISDPAFDAAHWGATREALGAVIHAVDAAGRTHRGVAALRLAYAAVGKGWVLAPTAWPVLRPVFDLGYAWFARHRYGISRWAAPWIERIEARRLARRMQLCGSGVCEHGTE